MNINLSIYKVIFPKLQVDADVILKLNSLTLTGDLSFSLRSRCEMFFVRALQLLVIAFHRTEPLNATVFHVTPFEAWNY